MDQIVWKQTSLGLEQKLYADRQTIAIFNLPDSIKSKSDALLKIENLGISYYTINFVPSFVIYGYSCHACQINRKEVYDHEYAILLTLSNLAYEDMCEKIKSISVDIKIQLICQIRLYKDSICPMMLEEQKERNDLEGRLLGVIEEYFSDEQIFKHKDILISMSNEGWVPLSVLESKLEEMIIIGSDRIAKKIETSECLELDDSKSCVRRINRQLPFSKEHLQIVLLDIPDVIKSIRQMPGYLQIEGSSVEYFDYSIHAAIISLSSRDEAVKLVRDVQNSDKMKAKLLVPCLDDNIVVPSDNIDLNKLLASLALHQQPVEQRAHLTRLRPNELLYEFDSSFVPPTQVEIDALVNQANFYFSDANVLKDLFMLKKIKSNPGGWVDLAIIARFKQMIKLSGDSLDKVVYALCFSDEVQISRDARCLRRRLPLPEWDPSIYTRSLFLWHLPRYVDSYEDLDRVFRDEGRFDVRASRLIKTGRNVPADLRKLVDKITALGKVDCAVVEFQSREAMIAADDFIHMKWASVMTFYLDTKEELPKPAVIVSKSSKSSNANPPPIPISTIPDETISSVQAGTRIDPRFWHVARLLSAKKRTEIKAYNNKNVIGKNETTFSPSITEYPPLTSAATAKCHPNKPVKNTAQSKKPSHLSGKPNHSRKNCSKPKQNGDNKENLEVLPVAQ